MTKPIEDSTNAAAIRAALDVPNTAALNAKYTKPANGIPASDLDADPAGRTLLTATSAAERKQVLGLDQVNNTSDANKPISTAQQTALDAKMTATLPAMQAVLDAGTAQQKAAFQSLVSGDRAPRSAVELPDGFTPMSLPGLTAWYDSRFGIYGAGDADPVDGGDVSIWRDCAGNQYTCTSTTTIKPKYSANGFGPGIPAVMLGGNSYFQSASGFLTAAFASAMTVFVVAAKCGRPNTSGAKGIVSIASGGYVIAVDDTTKARTFTLTGITGWSGASPGTGTDGVYCIALGASNVYAYSADVTWAGSGGSMAATTLEKTGTSGALAITGNALQIGTYYSNIANAFDGGIGCVLIYNRQLSLTEIQQVNACLEGAFFPGKALVTCKGNSLTSGVGSTGGGAQVLSASGTNYPGKLLALLNGAATVRTDAFPGRNTQQIIDGTALYSDVLTNPYRKHVHIVWELTNQQVLTSSVGNTLDRIERACRKSRDAGAIVIVGTKLPRGDSGDDAREIRWTNAINASIRANYLRYADGIADFAADARLFDFNNSTYFDADKVHLKDAGYGVVAGIAHTAVLPWL